MIAPRTPSGAVAVRPYREGEIARWRLADMLPYLEAALFPGADDRPPSVTVTTGPARFPLEGVTDPAELRRCAWLLLDAARWLDTERARLDLPPPAPEPDPQLTIYDYPEAFAR